MNIVIGDYSIKIQDRPAFQKIQKIDFYKENPELFLKAYTDLSDDDIEEIMYDDNLINTIVQEIYKRLNLNDENEFIKSVNNSLEIINSLDGVIIIYLYKYFGHSLIELMKLNSDELLTMFIFELKFSKPNINIDIEQLKSVLTMQYSEETVQGFIENCCDGLVKHNEQAFEKELQNLENL